MFADITVADRPSKTSTWSPFVVGIVGAARAGSSSEMATSLALRAAARCGAKTKMISGRDLLLPIYDPLDRHENRSAAFLIEALRMADGVILSSPCYHGGMSGLIKNALDYTEEMRSDERPYLEQRAVGVIGTGSGYQGPVAVVSQLRQVVHALRGWNTPLGVAINSAAVSFQDDACCDANVSAQIDLMAQQVVAFARMSRPDNDIARES